MFLVHDLVFTHLALDIETRDGSCHDGSDLSNEEGCNVTVDNAKDGVFSSERVDSEGFCHESTCKLTKEDQSWEDHMSTVELVALVGHVLEHLHAQSHFWEQRAMHDDCRNDSCGVELSVSDKHWDGKSLTCEHQEDNTHLNAKSDEDQDHQLS